ncbi:MAG: AraC family transcriptional regulator [Acetatifactor sp.]|nr:AraC family transcriptional regulator [Acetatifactor sp.]
MNTIYYIGYSATHPADFVYDFPDTQNSYLLLLTHTPACFWVDGELKSCPAHTSILFKPGQKIYYTACGGEYANDWLRFGSDEGFVTGFPAHGLPFSVSDPEYVHSLFKLLTWESTYSSKSSELIIENLLRILFQKLHEDVTSYNDTPHAIDLMQLHKQIMNNPQRDWTVQSMADTLHISAGYLQFIYRQTFGTTCMEDVIEGRVRLAKEQLIYTDYTVSEISDRCGYNNIEHFCRQFRKLTGLTPGAFRKAAKEQKGFPINHPDSNGQ